MPRSSRNSRANHRVQVTLASVRSSEISDNEGDELRNTLDNVTRMTGWMRRLRTNSSLENALAALSATDEAKSQKHGRHSVESMDGAHLESLIQLATGGDRGAQYRLACNYSETPDMEEPAFAWMKKAAAQGMPCAVSKLALFYYHGYGTDQNTRRAFELASLASEGSIAESLGLLGMMHMLGDDSHSVPQDAKLSYKFSSRGALLGDGLAQRTLAKLYSEGLGVEKNSELAVYWIKKAATRHNVFQHHAQYELGMWYWEGHHVSKDYTKGMSWLLRAAKGRLPDALLMLGMIFEDGMGGYKKNPQRSAFFYEEAVLEEEPEGMYRLGKLHCIYDSTHTSAGEAKEDWADFTYGIEMLNQAVARGHADAFDLLEATVEIVARRYNSMEEFRQHIARRAAGPERDSQHALCVAIQAALHAIALYQDDNESVTGLSDSEIDALQSKVLKKQLPDQRCCICLSNFEKGETVRVLGCKHHFHKDCVDQWLKQNRKCPLCKTNAVEVSG